jgi:hypothetical protein
MRYALGIALLLAACGGNGGGNDVAAQPDSFVDDLLADESTGPEVTGDIVPADGGSEAGEPDITEPDGEAPDAVAELPDFAAPDVDPEEWAKQYGTPCDSADKVGWFTVDWNFGTSGVNGEISDRVNTGLIMEKAGAEGPCVLLKRVEPFCNPECPSGEQCAPGDKCQPFPKPVSAGTVTVTGLVKPVSMKLKGTSYFDTDFEGMAWVPGTPIELSASGGEVEAFSLQGAGVSPLAIPFADWVLKKGTPLVAQWEPSDGPGQVQVEINLMQHASNSHDLVCVLDDTGEFEIPQKLTDALIDLGVSGAPVVLIFRRTVDSVQVASGCIELQVKAYGTAYLTLK